MSNEAIQHSRWIWVDNDPDETNVWAFFRRRFDVVSPSHAWLNITADLRYAVWVNGRMIGLGPPKYHITTPTFDRYPLDEFLNIGNNAICVQVYSLGNVTDISSCMPRRGGLLAAIETDGHILPTDRRWRATRETAYLKTALRRGEFQPHNEVFDARRSLGEPWRTDVDDSAWPAATEISQSCLMEPWERLEERDIPRISWRCKPPDRVIETGIAQFSEDCIPDIVAGTAEQIATAHRSADSGNRIVVHAGTGVMECSDAMLPSCAGIYVRWDFGRLWTGYPVIEISGSAGTIVDLSYGECLIDGRIDPRKDGLHYFDRLILGDSPLRHRIFWPKCFRYVQADIRNGNAEIRALSMEASNYPVQRRGNFHSSDAVLDQAWEIAVHTLELCMDDNYMDTPWRERGSWLGDIVPEAHGNFYAFGDAPLMRRFLVHHARGQMPDGQMHGKYPGGGENFIPTWSLTFPLTLDDYIRHTGDTAIARALWATVWRIAEWLERYRTTEGLYGDFPIEVSETVNRYVFIDWAPVNTAGANAALNAFAYGFYRASERLALLAGADAPSAICRERADRLRSAYRDLLWDEQRGVFVNGRQHGKPHRRWGVQENYLAVVFGLADDRQQRSIVKRLKQEDVLSYFVPDNAAYGLPAASWAIAVNQYRWDDEKMVPLGTPYFAYWATQALCEMGMLQEALDLIRRHWGEFSRQGGSTTWEQWNSEASLSHGWGTAPIVVCGKYVLGVSPSPDDPAHIEIFPQRADLRRARGRVGFPLGIISIDWQWNGRWELDLHLPAPYRATIGLPSTDGMRVHVNGAPAQTSHVRRHMADYCAVELQPGTYKLTS